MNPVTMSLNEIFDELLDLAKRTGYTIRRENGRFQSGYCILHDQKIIILNKNTTLETKSAVLARCLASQEIDDMFVKPAVRDFLDNEMFSQSKSQDLSIEINY